MKIFQKVVNVAKSPEVDSWLDETVLELGGLHGAVNLAGTEGTTGKTKIQDISNEEWEALMSVNVNGVFYCMRAELRRMAEGGSIVSASSIAGLKGIGLGGPYSVSKVSSIEFLSQSCYKS